MKQLEPGMLCRVVDAWDDINGMLVTIIKLAPAGTVLPKGKAGEPVALTDGAIPYADAGTPPDGWISQGLLQPIDHRPADEDFQAEFRRMINTTPVRA